MTSAQVLVVEDEKIVAADIRENLRSLGYSVTAVISSGEEAITSATESRPDLVLMDIHLKGRIDGIEAAKIVRSRLNIPVIYITAFADNATIQRAKMADAYGYILKPFGKKELQTAIEIALHKHRGERRLRTNEEWLMSMLRGMPEAVIAVDGAGSVCLMNPAAERMSGGALEDMLGAHWSDVVEFLDGAPAGSTGNPFEAALENGVTLESQRLRVRFPRAKRAATLLAGVAPIPGPSKSAGGAVFVCADITGQHDLEWQYHSRRHLEGLQRLAGGVAHSLAGVLTVISGYAEALSTGQASTDASRLKDVAVIQNAAAKATGLAHQLLSFSRRAPATPENVELNRVLADAQPILAHAAGPFVRLECEYGAVAGEVKIDPSHLEQILMALVMNARDAAPNGGGILIRTASLELDCAAAARFVDMAPGRYAGLEVIDNGEGIPYEAQPHVFEPFFTARERTKGAGLGLAVAYGLVKQSGGHIWFESEPGQGARFAVYLPVVDAAPAGAAPRAPTVASATETVLIVDEAPELRLMVRETLARFGYDVLEAHTGGEAVKICEQTGRPVHLVVSDVLMPSMTGPELAVRLTQTPFDPKMLFLSSYSSYVLKHHGAVDERAPVLQKPFTGEELAAKVREILDA